MKNLLLTAAIILASASMGAKADESILFCTKSLPDPSFQPSLSNPPAAAGQIQQAQMDAYDTLGHGQHGSVVDLRHCFMAKAFVEQKYDGVMTLTALQTSGYGQRATLLPNQRTGVTYQEGWYGDEIIGCVSVLTVSDEQLADETWRKTTDYMRNAARQQDYSPTDHNCCTVAYGAVQHIGGDLSYIHPHRFNLMGIGILWKASDLITGGGLSNKVGVWAGASYDFATQSLAPSSSHQTDRNEL